MVVAGPAAALIAVVVGILAGERRGPGEATAVLAAGVVAGVVALAPRIGRARLLALVVACFLLGAAGMQRALHGLVASPLTHATVARDDVSVRATLVDDPDGTRWSTEALARVDHWTCDGRTRDHQVRRVDAGGRRVLVQATGVAAARLRVLDAGERFTAQGWLGPLDGFDTREQWRHAVATLHVTNLTEVARPGGALLVVANRARGVVLGGADGLGPVDRALLAGFLLGDTRGVPESVQEQFRAAGLTHLTAVSGGNVAFVLALVAPLVRRLGLRGRLALSVAVLVLFGTMTRWEPSVARAIVMAAIALVAGHLGRPSVGLRVLLLAATILLLVDPFLLHSVGFLLSCGASLGIALWSRRIAAALRGPVWLRDVLAVTAAAQLGVLPVLIPVFGSVPLVALPANLVAVPLAEPLTMWGIIAGLLDTGLGSLSPVVPRLLALPSAALLHALLAVADLAARVPVAVDACGLAAIAALIALAGGCVTGTSGLGRPWEPPATLRRPRMGRVNALMEAPHIDVDGVRIFRQVVIPATPRGSLRPGRLFRSGTLVGLSDAGRATFDGLRITDIVDLRSERDMGGYDRPDVGAAVRIHAIPVLTDPTGAHPVGAAIRSRDRDRLNEAIVDRDAVVEWMRQGYEHLALDETESFARVLRVVADAGGGVVMNCAAGKDRTGWAVAITLLAIGADVDAVTEEFLLSNAGPPPAGMDPAMAELMAPLTGVRAEYLQAGLDAVATRWSSIDEYLEVGLGVDDELRGQLLGSLVEQMSG